MRKVLIALLFLTIPLGPLFYGVLSPHHRQDELAVALGDPSFLPIKPPSKIDTLGAIYYIEPDTRRIQRLCSPTPHVLNKYKSDFHESPSGDVMGVMTLRGKYASNIRTGNGAVVEGRSSANRQEAIELRFKLTHVHIWEMDVDVGKKLLDELMNNNKDCNDAVSEYWHLSGYICQDTELLVASALFERASDQATGASVDLTANKPLASGIEGAMNVTVAESEGRLTVGDRLQWAVQMPPLCIAPPWAWFPRTFPRTNFDRFLNFLKFNQVEQIIRAVAPEA